jgi:hypothetical protein
MPLLSGFLTINQGGVPNPRLEARSSSIEQDSRCCREATACGLFIDHIFSLLSISRDARVSCARR